MRQSINFCELTRHVLGAKAISTKELGRRIGLSQAAVSRLASGVSKTTHAEAGVALIYEAGGSVVLPVESARQQSGGGVSVG